MYVVVMEETRVFWNNAAASPRVSQCRGVDARDKRGHDSAV